MTKMGKYIKIFELSKFAVFFVRISAHEAIRRYKTLCERFRRETIKQSSIPNYASNWSLFDKFAALKDAQTSDDRRSTQRIKTEDPYEGEMVDLEALMAAAAAANAANAANAASSASTANTVNNTKKRKKPHNNSGSDSTNGCLESSPDTNGSQSEPAPQQNGLDTTAGSDAAGFVHLPSMFDAQSVEDDGDSEECLNVEPSYIGGSTDLSTDSIAAFCQFLEASLKKMTTDRSDELIEEISGVLFRKKREIRVHDEQNGTISN